MNLDKYKHFTAEEFSLDPNFKENILRSSGEHSSFLRALAQRFPEKREAITEARRLVLQMDRYYQEQKPSAEEKAAVLEEIMRRHRTKNVRKRRRVVRYWPAIAASVLALVVTVWLFRSQMSVGEDTYSTSFAEMAEYPLPDGSLVSLNANSRIRLSETWEEGAQREVWLEGEAYFKVAKKASGEAKFIVHTNGPDIEVLGTQFNVNTRQDRTLVFLEEGRIQLKNDRGDLMKVMEPGDLADYSGGTADFFANVDSGKYLLWLKGYFTTEDLTYEEVIARIEEIYGVEMQIERPELREKGFPSQLPTSNLEELLTIFENLYHVTATIEGDEKLRIR